MKRPFRGLRRPPDLHYDVVVIGAGIGGLVAANLLARQGARTLLVERHYMVGGYCSTFRRAGYTFDAATHFYPLLGNPTTLTGKLLVELGVETGWVEMDPVDTFHFPDGSRFAVPADFATYLAAVKAMFPHQEEALDTFFATVRELYLQGLLHYFRNRPLAQLPRLGPWIGISVAEALQRFFSDPKLRLLLAADCPHWGSPPSRTSFVFDSMLRLSYFLGNYYPRGGSQAFADELARVFEFRGGHLLTSTAATRIVVSPLSGARAVELEILRGDQPRQGSRFRVEAGAVVASGDLLHTYRDLIGVEHLPPGAIAELETLRPSYPCYLIHLGLRDVPAELLDQLQGYYWDHFDTDRVGRDALRFKLFAPTLYEPAMAPPGGQVLIIQKVLAQDPATIVDWPAHKQQVTSWALAELERLSPGIGNHVVTMSSATAATSERFTGNWKGAMLGFEMAPDQLGDRRPGVESPVRGLYLAGHWTRPGGGITPVIVSAQHAVAAIARDRSVSPLEEQYDGPQAGARSSPLEPERDIYAPLSA